MKIKKFYGVDNHDVMTKVKYELGTDAVILHQKKVKPKGLFGIFKKPIVEILAAVEEAQPSSPRGNSINMAKNQEIQLREKVSLKTKDKELETEITHIKTMLSTVVNQMQNINSQHTMQEIDIIKQTYLYNLLHENEIDEDLIIGLLTNYSKEIDLKEINDKSLAKDFLSNIIPKTINNEFQSNFKVIFFIGPTGVGKTTTIAKLAAKYSLEDGLNVGLVSADTYRIAAVEQLRVYSEILNIPLEVIYSHKEINSAIKNLIDKDIILVDTAGRSHKNNEQVEELELLLNEVKSKNIYLVISSTTKSSDLQNILNTYAFLKDYKIIFTKLDEVSSYGTILNLAIEQPELLTYITTGQSVPDDIASITSDKIMDLLLKEI